MKHVLLVEPSYKTFFPPLGLMRISTLHKQRGDRVDFRKEGAPGGWYFSHRNRKLRKHYDIIYITSLFTYRYDEVVECIQKYQKRFPGAEIKVGGILATLLPQKIEEDTGIAPNTGLLMEAEECPPDYSLFPKYPNSISFTSRGCFRKCSYCVVPILEPNFITREYWEMDVNPNSEKIIFWDNNWLFSPNFREDVEKLKSIGKPYDFNQGLDCRLFDEKKAKALAQTKIEPLRFAFDGPSQEGHIQDAIHIAQNHGFHDIRVYVLYNSEEEYDTPEYFFQRINELNKLKVAVYPMRYRPIDSTQTHWVSPRWDKKVLRGLKLNLIFFCKDGLIKKGRKGFVERFGTNPEEFERKMKETYEYDRNLWRKKRKSKK